MRNRLPSKDSFDKKLNSMKNLDFLKARKAAFELHGKETGEKLFNMAREANRRRDGKK